MIKRPLFWAGIAFASGILVFLLNVNIVIISVCGAILLCGVLMFKRRYSVIFVVLIAVFALGSVRAFYAQVHIERIFATFGLKTMPLTLTVTDFSENGKCVARFFMDEKNYLVYLDTVEDYGLLPGDIIKASVTFKEPYTSKVTASDFAKYMASRSVYLFADAADVELVGTKTDGIRGNIYSLRRYIDKIGGKRFFGDWRGLFNATVLGDKRFISEELDLLLRVSGLSHIAVVSGMHLSVIITLQMVLFERLFGKSRKGSILSVLCAAFITFLTGAGASVVRAFVMCVIYQTARLLRRENDSLTTLALTAILMLFYSPYNIFNAGFVLSVLSVLGILLYAKSFAAFFEGIMGKALRDSVAVTLSAQIMTIVPVMYYFSSISPYALLANALAMAYVSALLIFSMLLCILNTVPLIGGSIALIIKFLCSSVIEICCFVQKLPASYIEIGSVNTGIILAWLLLLVISYTGFKNKKIIKAISLVFLSIYIAFLCGDYFSARRINADVICYGRNSMTAMSFPSGERVLVDCPNSSDAIKLNGGRIYDIAIMTNGNPKEIESLVIAGKVKNVVMYGPEISYKRTQTLKSNIEKSGANVIFLGRGEYFYYKDISVSFPLYGEAPQATEVRYKGKSYVSLQNLSRRHLRRLKSENTHIHCDVLKAPQLDVKDIDELKEMTAAKIIMHESSFTINLY